jgi:transposase
MAKYDQLTELLGLPNVQVTHYQLVGPNRLNLFIESTVAAGLCPTCQQLSLSVHDYGEPQLIRDLPIWNRRCWLRYSPRRFECATCETTFVERVVWREPGFDYTIRYEQFVYEQVRRHSVAQAARDERLSEDIVQGIFERWAKKRSPSGASPA